MTVGQFSERAAVDQRHQRRRVDDDQFVAVTE
jgi:hypothetical protein